MTTSDEKRYTFDLISGHIFLSLAFALLNRKNPGIVRVSMRTEMACAEATTGAKRTNMDTVFTETSQNRLGNYIT